eukprot:m.359591 g.359591  ORF g.359591 m.359591 type:complete len:790 (+) comp20761_c0_seq2:108-2477(+)
MPGEVNDSGGGDEGAALHLQNAKNPIDVLSARPRCRHGWLKPRQEDILLFEPENHVDPADETGDQYSTMMQDDNVMQEGIEVTLISGSGLMVDVTSTTGAFVKTTITGGQTQTSTTTTPIDSPKWEEGEIFFFPSQDWKSASFEFDVFQKDSVSTKSLGCGLIPSEKLQPLQSGRTIMHDVVLKKTREDFSDKKTATLGSLKVKMRFARQNPKKAAQQSKRTGKLVTIDIVEGRYMNAMDANGKADPYVKVLIGKQKRQTKTCPKTLEPKFKERVDFMVTDLSEKCEFKVYDEDFMDADDLMGTCSIDLADFKLDEPVAKWYDLFEDDAKELEAGQLFINVTVSSMWCEPKILSKQEKKKFAGFLKIKIKKAKGLKAADKSAFSRGPGKSDPFAVVELGRIRYRTRTIYKTLNPQWDRAFEIGVNDVFGSVLVTVNDEDAGGKTYDFLGCVSISLLDIAKGDVWYALKERDLLTRATGDILISCEFHYDEVKAYKSLLIPREVSYVSNDDVKFKPKELVENINRITKGFAAFGFPFKFVGDVSNMKYGSIPFFAFWFLYSLLCLYGRLGHGPFLLILALYLQKVIPKPKKTIHLSEDGDVLDEYDSDEDNAPKKKVKKKPVKKDKKTGMIQKFKMLRRIAKEQNKNLNNIAGVLERIKNVFLWEQKLVTMLFVGALVAATLVCFLFQGMLCYLFLMGGLGKMFSIIKLQFKSKNTLKQEKKEKKRKKAQPQKGNPVFNIMQRVPTDLEIDLYRRYRPQTVPKQQRELDRIIGRRTVDADTVSTTADPVE